MLKHRFVCSNKSDILLRINQMIAKDWPSGKSIWGGDLYKAGIHFQESGDKIKGFYLAEGEEETVKGSPLRVCFSGEFVEEENNLFFDVHIYPRIFEFIFLIVAMMFLSYFGKVAGSVIAVITLCLFGKSYINMVNDIYEILSKIFC